MYQYVLRRLLYAIPTLLGITMLIFFVLRILPGDPLVILYGEGGVGSLSDADRAAIRHQLGFDRPLYQQYGAWLTDLLTGNLGHTLARGDSVAEIIQARGVLTGEIAVLAVLISWLVGLPAGIFSAMRQNSVGDYLARFCTIIFLAVPGFWVAMLVVIGLLMAFHYRPPLGIISPWEDPLANLKIVAGPGIVLGLGTSAYIARLARSSFLEVIREDYVRTARAKGARETMVVLHHALRNAVLPVLTISGVLFGFLLSASVAVEQAFAVSGLGTALVQAFQERDLLVVQTLVLLYGAVFVVVNLLIDLAYVWVDPRIRYT
ncbi:MAG TPA: ABC transporter permease [Candidatus Saccharimonadia bacterium]|nr:ABC transporter permease [Candidatus Saccharimonadia bacterium]